jgi:hypothetical protein
MADTKVSQLTAATEIADSDIVYVVVGGASYKMTFSSFKTAVLAGYSPISGLDDLSDVNTIGIAQGNILYYNGTSWVVLAPGTDGHVLTTGGAGANPAWEAAAGGGGGGGWIQVATTTLGSDTVTTSITGLDLNTDGRYRIILNGARVGSGLTTFTLNSDATTSNYSGTYITSSGSPTYAATTNSAIPWALPYDTDGYKGLFDMEVVKTDTNRCYVTLRDCYDSVSSPTIRQALYKYSVSSSNITSLQFVQTSPGLDAGTIITVYKYI